MQESAAADLLDQFGAIAVTTEASEDQPVWLDAAAPQSPNWTKVRVSGLFSADIELDDVIAGLQDAELIDKPTAVEVDHLADQIWERVWLTQFRAFEAAPGVWVVPNGQRTDPDAELIIELEPGLAFGTGTHPTTALCLQALTQFDLSDRHVVDYGCGSGILAVAALKLGAARATAVDIDPRAIEATIANAGRNGVGGQLSAHLADEIALDHTADLVIANILADTLVERAGALRRCLRRHGVLMLSGILVDQVDRVANAFTDEFSIAVRCRDGWSLLIAHPLTAANAEMSNIGPNQTP